jgi:hypothetical protein
VTREDADAVLRTRGWEVEATATMSDALADWIATGLTDPRRSQPSWELRRSHKSSIGDPDDPTTEEIAHAANAAAPPLKHRVAVQVARATKRAAWVAAGQRIAHRDGMREATLMALANIAGCRP